MPRSTQTDKEWVRDVSRDVDELKRATVARIGSWALWEDAAGNLVAGRDGKAVVLARITDLADIPVATTIDPESPYATP